MGVVHALVKSRGRKEVFTDRVSFELKLSKALPEVQKELKEPGAGRVLRISKEQQ